MEIDERALYQYIGKQLKARRQAAGLTQQRLADRLEMTRTSITNIEHGRQRLPLHLLYRLCLTLEIDTSSVLPSIGTVTHSAPEPPAVPAHMEEMPPRVAELIRELMQGTSEEEP